jgi:hypothetical protein
MARSADANIALSVAVVCMPDQSERLEALRAADVPRLVVVAAGTEAPTVVGDREEWIRLPAEAADVLARIDALNACAARRSALRPSLDNDGLLRVGAAWVALSTTNEKLAKIFLADFGHVVPTGTLLRALEKDQTVSIRQRISRLRQSIEPLGLAITSVQPRGYLMNFASGMLTHGGENPSGASLSRPRVGTRPS